MDGIHGHSFANEPNGNYRTYKEGSTHGNSPKSSLSPRSFRSDSLDLAVDAAVETSIEQLCRNVYDMQSSDHSPSRRSFISYGEESRIDSELCHLVGADFKEVEITKEVVKENKEEDKDDRLILEKDNGSTNPNPAKMNKSSDQQFEKNLRKPNAVPAMRKRGTFSSGVDNQDRGPFLLKQTKDLIASGENPKKALKLALQAVKSFEQRESEKPSLELVMCLHVLAAIHCSLGQYDEAIPVLERSIEIPVLEEGQTHALAKFAGCMQLGDTYAMLGQIENSILFYTAGLEIQRQVLGEKDPRFGETCRYVAEAHVQALQFDEAGKLCQIALDIHGEKGLSTASLEEAADRRLMGLICDSKGDYEASLEHYVLASMAMAAKGNETDVASIDCSIGDAYLALARFDEAVCAYKKSLALFKSRKGENHPSVASVYVHMAALYNKIGKFREAKSYCGNALRILGKPKPGIPAEDIGSGLIDISAIYQSMNELDQAVKLLQKAQKIFTNVPGQQSTVAGIEAQMGVMYYMSGKYSDSYDFFKNAISKLRASGEKKSVFFGIALNQMGLACVQRYLINEAADLFEEARSIFEKEYGSYHHETLAVYSNLAGTYDAMGRLDDAIEILEYIVRIREDKLGTANPDVDDEKRRLSELLKEAGRIRNRKFRSLETLLHNKQSYIIKDGIKVL